MATTVGQHSVASFTSPVNGTTPIDANTVRGNDNTVRSAYVDHDADPGIHVQSSTLASRPTAGTVGRKWITEDSGVYTLWFDDGTNWHPVSSENVALTVLAGETLAKGDVVKVTGWNNGQDLPEVVKTTSASDTAFAVMTAAVSSGSMGYATNTGIVQDVNTAAYSVGTILYANGSGGFTSTKPTSGHYQPCAYVLRSNTNNGVYYVEFSSPRIVESSANTASTIVLRDASGDFSAGTITATAVNATTLDLTNLEVTNIKAKDGTQAIAIADATGKLTISDGVLLSGLTASQAVFTDSSKNLVSNAITGSGNVVMSASPTLTGTVTAATLNATTLGGTLSTAAQPNVTSVGTLTSLSISGQISSTAGAVISGSGASTSARYVVLSTTGGDFYTGIESSAGGSLLGGSSAYARIFGTSAAYPIEFFTNNVKRASIDSSGNLAVDTNTLYVDAANNRVGVGTASPGYALQVDGASTAGFVTPLVVKNPSTNAASATKIGFDGGGTVWGEIGASYNSNSPYMAFFVRAGSEKMRLDDSGRLGIGTASPAARLEVASGNQFFSTTSTTANTTLASIGVYHASYPSANQFASIDFLNGPTNWFAGSAIVFKTNGSADTTANPATEKMRLDGSGNLGLGVTPSYKLHVVGSAALFANGTSNVDLYLGNSGYGLQLNYSNGDIAIRTNTSERWRFTNNGELRANADGTASTPIFSRVGDDNTGIFFGGADILAISTGGAERARITSGGEFLVNATATVNASIASVVGTASTNVLALKNGDNGNYFLYCASTANAERLRIEGDGDVYNLNGTYGTISDIRHKQDVIDAPSQWDDLKAIRFRKYRMKVEVETNPDAPYLLGVVAQELEQTSPGLVDEQSEFEEQEVTDEDGNVTTERVQVGTTKTVKSSILLMKAAVALQEAMARIEALEARLEALEA